MDAARNTIASSPAVLDAQRADLVGKIKAAGVLKAKVFDNPDYTLPDYDAYTNARAELDLAALAFVDTADDVPDAAETLYEDLAYPGAPTSVTASTADGTTDVSLSWTAPDKTGAAALTGYTLTASPGGATVQTGTTATTATFSGLTEGTTYTFTVAATNSRGTGPASVASNSVTLPVLQPPSAPTIGTTSLSGTTATVRWTAAIDASSSAIIRYDIVSSPPTTTVTAAANATSVVVSGLATGTSYTFTVRAVNAAGTGSFSSPSNSVTTSDLPSAPTIGLASLSGTTATVRWTAAINASSSAIIRYDIVSSPATTTVTAAADATSVAVTGLVADTTYTFTVRAVNAAGNGAFSDSSNELLVISSAHVLRVTFESSGFDEGFYTLSSWGAPPGFVYPGFSTDHYVSGTRSLRLDSNLNSMRITSPVVTIGTDDFTFEFQFYATEALGTNVFRSIFEVTNGQVYVTLGNVSNALVCQVTLGGHYNAPGGTYVSGFNPTSYTLASSFWPGGINAWHKVAVVRRQSQVKVFYDNQTTATTALMTQTIARGTYYQIGCGTQSHQALLGYLDDVRLTLSALYVSTNIDTTGSVVTSQAGGYTLYRFIGTGQIRFPVDKTVQYLIVAGGGGGGGTQGGGGGGGGLLSGTRTMGADVIYSITVGAGGVGSIYTGTGVRTRHQTSGGHSILSGSDISTMTAIGGGNGGDGGGATGYKLSSSGGSGGGGGGSTSDGFRVARGTGTTGQGNNGGTGAINTQPTGGGGGGRNGAGANSSSSKGGNGGAGFLWSIDNQTYAAGGGGGVWANKTAGTGGANAGDGGVGASGENAPANFGGGGGGGVNQNGGNGGSGIVILAVT
jgi:chitodextrinase